MYILYYVISIYHVYYSYVQYNMNDADNMLKIARRAQESSA